MLLVFFFLSGFSFTWHSRFTGQQGKGEAIFNSSLPFPPTSRTLIYTLAGRLLQRAHLCTWLAGLKPGTFGWVILNSINSHTFIISDLISPPFRCLASFSWKSVRVFQVDEIFNRLRTTILLLGIMNCYAKISVFNKKD